MLDTLVARELKRVSVILAAFEERDKTMPIQVAATFLRVAQNEGCCLGDIVKQTGWPQSTISRHLLDLGGRDRKGGPGLGLVESCRDESELRKNVYTLSPKGRKLVNTLVSLATL